MGLDLWSHQNFARCALSYCPLGSLIMEKDIPSKICWSSCQIVTVDVCLFFQNGGECPDVKPTELVPHMSLQPTQSYIPVKKHMPSHSVLKSGYCVKQGNMVRNACAVHSVLAWWYLSADDFHSCNFTFKVLQFPCNAAVYSTKMYFLRYTDLTLKMWLQPNSCVLLKCIYMQRVVLSAKRLQKSTHTFVIHSSLFCYSV